MVSHSSLLPSLQVDSFCMLVKVRIPTVAKEIEWANRAFCSLLETSDEVHFRSLAGQMILTNPQNVVIACHEI